MSTWRTTFETPRSSEYFEEGNLRALIGHEKPLWPLVLIKELIDNALDACEAAGIAPDIAVTVEADSFTVADNGSGLSPDTITRSLNYDSRISDKKWYVGPSRGQLGSALKTLWPACYVATGQRGVVEITACGVHHTITAYGGAIKSHDQEPATVKNGTFLRVHWPQIACQLTHDGRQLFYRGEMSYAGRMDEVVVDVVRDFAAGNPHAAFSVTARGATNTFSATDTEWRKWRSCDRGSAHWYSVDEMKNLLTAHHREEKRLDELGANRRLTLRDVLADFDGLKGTVVRKRVLEQAGLSGMTLDDVFECDDAFVSKVAKSLLDAARANTRVVKPERLGLIGTEHMGKTLAAYGASGDFVARYLPGVDGDGLPYLVEAAFGVRKERSRKIIFAVNNSIVFQVPTQHISETLNTGCRVESHDPVVLVIHMTCPKFAFTSQGKTSLVMTAAMQESLDKLLINITKKHTKDKKSEAARKNRDAVTDQQIEKSMAWNKVQEEKNEIKATAYKFMAEAYRRASEPYNWAKARQVMYQARKLVMNAIGKWGGDSYFTQHLLVDYQREHPKECKNWHVRYDARGHMLEPHGGKFFGIGTGETRDYINSWTDGSEDADIGSLHLESKFTTSGPTNRYSAALFVEKEGFDDLIRHSGIMERYDLGLFSSKGMATTAARELDDEMSRAGVTIFALHDFDAAGLRICHWLSHDNERYQFKEPPNVIDIGLRLADVKRLKLESEQVDYAQGKDPREILLECDDITKDEIAFLVSSKQWNTQTGKEYWSGHRVELNAMTSRQLIELIERKLVEHGVKKVIPNGGTLKIAWRRAQKIKVVNAAIASAMNEIDDDWACPAAPRNLATQVREMLRRKPLMPWDEVLARIAKRGKR
jgi:DNA topoisomerase VI subunit B